jgi:hypothetical protein
MQKVHVWNELIMLLTLRLCAYQSIKCGDWDYVSPISHSGLRAHDLGVLPPRVYIAALVGEY